MQKMSKEKYWDELISYPDLPSFDIPNRLRSGYEIRDECVRIKTKQGKNKPNNSGINERADIDNQMFYQTAALEMTIRTRRFLNLKVTVSL